VIHDSLSLTARLATQNELAIAFSRARHRRYGSTEQTERIRAGERKTGRIIPYLFAYLSGARRVGTPRHDFRKAWAKACEKAGCPGMLRRDFRRTAVRNTVNDGTREKVAMLITGHRTRAVFDRYHRCPPGSPGGHRAHGSTRRAQFWAQPIGVA
jgi:integrase